MPEILSQTELLRLARKSAGSTRSSSPGSSSPYPVTSPAVQPGALSPPPPTHYLRNKSRTEETSDISIKLLRKRSEIYDRDRSRRSVVTRAPQNAPDGLLFQQDLFRPAHLESSYTRAGTRLPDGVGSLPNPSPSFSPSKQWAFLETDPMSPPPTAIMRSPFARERDSLLLLRPTHSHSTDSDSPGERSRSLASTEPQAANSVDSRSNPTAGSSQASLRDRDTGGTGAPAHRLGLNRFHRGRSTGSDSSISISVSSHASSSFFPPSLEPCSSYSPPVQSSRLSQFASSGPQIASPATPYEREPYSPLSFAPHSPHSAPALFDVQKRRRAHAFDNFTSYTESLPYHSRSSNHSHHNRRERRPSVQDKAGTVSEPVKRASSHSRTDALHSMRSAPGFSDGEWRKRSLDIEMDLEDEHDNGKADNASSTSQLDGPKRKSSCRITRSIKSMLTSKSATPTN